MADIRRMTTDEFYGTGKKNTENVKVRRLSSDQFYSEQSNKHVLRPAPAPAPPAGGLGVGGSLLELGKSNIREGARLAQTMAGAGVEMAGNALSQHPVDLAMDAASGLSAMTPLPLDDKAVGLVRENVLGPRLEAGTNHFLGARAASQKAFGPIVEAPILQEDPRIADVEYLGDAPIGAKISKGMSDVGGALPSQAPTIAAGLAFGPTGARIVGGAIEGAANYEQNLKDGLTPEQAFRESAVVAGGVGVFSGLPFDDAFKGIVPKKLQGKLASFIRSGVLESGSEAAEGGLDPFGQLASGRRKLESMEDIKRFVSDVATGVWEETSVIPATFVTGGIGGAMGEQRVRKIKTIPPELTKEAVRLAAEMEADTGDTASPVDRLEPGPNAPLQEPERFEEDYAPFDLPAQEQAPTAPQEDEEDFEALLASLGKENAVAPSPEAVVAPEPEPELSESEKQAEADLLAEFPELKGMLDAARRSGPLNDDLVNTILNADTVDSRDIPKVEVRKPVSREESLSKLIEERPALDVGRPLDAAVRPEEEGVPQGPARVTVRAQGRPRPGERQSVAVPKPEVRATVRGPEPQSTAVALPNEEPVMEAESVPFDLTAMPMEQIDAFMADEDAKMAAKESAVAKKYLTPEQQATLAKIPNTEYGQRLKAKMFSTISDEAADAWDETAMADDMETASRYRQVEMLREKLANFTGEDETEANKDLELFLRNANFDDPVDVRVLQELTQRYDAAGLDVNKMLRTARAAYGTWYYEQTRDPNEAMDMVASLDAKLGIPPQAEQPTPEAEFVGLQPRPRGQAPIALYNIPTPDGGKTTVTAETAKSQGFSVPEPPSLPATQPQEPVQAQSPVRATEIAPEPEVAPEAIRAAAIDLAGGKTGTRVRLADLREKLGGTPTQQDATLKQMQADGELVLMRNDDPQDITPRDEAAKLMMGENRRDLVYLKPEKPAPEAKPEAPKAAELPTEPYAVYGPIIAGGKERYAVRSASMNPRGGGDSLFETREEAEKEAKKEQARDEHRQALEQERDKRKEQEEQAVTERKADTMGGFLDGMPPMRQELIRKQMERKRSIKKTFMSAREYVDSLFDSGKLKVSTLEENKKKDPGSRAWNRMDNREQEFVRKEIEKAGKKTTYFIGDFYDGGGIDLGKTAYDYAQHKLESAKTEKKADDKPLKSKELTDVPETDFGNIPPAVQQADARLPKPKKGKGDDESGYVNMSLLNPMEALRILRGKLKDGKFIEFEQGFMGLKDLKVARSGKIKSLQMRGKLIAQDFENAWRKEWQKQNPGVKAKTVRFRDMPAETVEALNDYLEEKDAGVKAQLLSELPEGLRRPATQMRDLVDQMSQELIDMGIVEDDVQKVIADQMGFYLRRTYAIFQDPKYRDNIPKAVEDNARKWLREKFPTYTTNQIESALADLKGVGSEKEALNRLVQMGGVLGKLDRRTLGKRNEYDQAILDLWGVDKNGIDNFLNTVNAQAHMIANFEWLEDIKANGRGAVVLTPQDIAALPQGDEKAQWPFLNESDSRKAVSMLTRPKDPAASRSKALDKFIAKAESQGDAGTVEVLKKTKALFEKGMKLEDGKEVVDSRNLEGASKYAEQLQAEADKLQAEGVAAPRGKKGPLKAKSRVAQSKANKINRQIKAILEAEEQKANAEPDTFGPFGPLAGARVHPEFKAALQEAVQIQEVAPWIQKWNWFNRQLKQNVTTRDPASALRNFRSGVDFSMANGWMLYDAKNVPKRLTKALSIANVDIRRSHDPALREEYLKMVEYGIAGDTAIVGELNEIQKEAKKAEFVKAAEKALSPELVKAMGGADALATKLYQAGDDVFKIFGALTEQEHLMEATGMDADAALKEAATRVRRQFPTYSEVHKSLQKLRRTPVLGPFVAYQSEVPRNAWNAIAQMATEIKSDSPKVRAMGYRRAAGIMWATANRHAYKAAWLALLGLTPDDDDRIRKALPEYFQGHEFAITEGDKATGKYRGYNLSQADAYGPLKEPFWAALRGEDIIDAAKKATEAFGGGYVSPELGTQAIVSVLTGTDARGKDLFLETDTTTEKLGKTLGYVLGQYAVPSPIRRQFKAKSEEEHALEVFGTLTGYRFIDIDLPESLFWKAKDFKKYGTEQVRDAYTAARDGDTEAAKKQLKDLEAVRKDYFDELQEAYIAFRDTGLNQETMDAKLKEAGLSGKEIEAVKYGTLEPYTPPQKLTDMME